MSVESTENGSAVTRARFESVSKILPSFYFFMISTVIFQSIFVLQFLSAYIVVPWVLGICAFSVQRLFYWRRMSTFASHMSLDDMRDGLQGIRKAGFSLCLIYGSMAVMVSMSDSILFKTIAMMVLWCSAIGSALYVTVIAEVGKMIALGAGLCVVVVFSTAADTMLLWSVPVVVLMTLSMLDLINKNFRMFSNLVNSRAKIERLREEATDLAFTDPLTQLPNRRNFDDQIQRLVRSKRPFGVAIIDLDGFKPVNDMFGHGAGDIVLKEVGNRLLHAIKGKAQPYRLGGDEFAIILDRYADEGEAQAICLQAIEAIRDRVFSVRDTSIAISGSAGLAFSYGDSEAGEIVAAADMAMYRSKSCSPGEVVVFSDDIGNVAKRQAIIAQGLRAGISKREFTTVVQPIYRVSTNTIVGGEILARWQHPELGAVSPNEFITMAEETQLIEALTALLFRDAAEYARHWPENLRISFNLSAYQVVRKCTAERLLELLEATGIKPEQLQVEVTETAVMSDFEGARENLEALRAAGIRVALDDFGAGYSTFLYLTELPIDVLKVDRSLLQRVEQDKRVKIMLGSIVTMCKKLGICCVAEGVENQKQLDLVRRLQFDGAQGYFLGRPGSYEDFQTALQSGLPQQQMAV